MKNLWTLIKKDLLIDYNFLFNIKEVTKDKKTRNRFFMFLFGMFIFAFYIFAFVRFLLGLFDTFITTGFGEVFLIMGFIIYILMILFFGFTQMISRLYFSDDINLLLPLPVSSVSILMSKIISVSINSLILAALVVLPIVIKYGIALKEGLFFYIFAVLGTFAITIITLSIIAFIEVVVLRFINRLTNAKNLFQILSMVLMIGLVIGLQFFIRATNQIDVNNIPEIINNFLGKIYMIFPHLKLLSLSLISHSFIERFGFFVLLILISAGVLFLLSYLGSGSLIKGVMANKVVGKSGKKKNKVSVAGVRKPYWDIAVKEITEVFKTPIYAFNIVSIGVLIPVFMVVPIMINGDSKALLSGVMDIYKSLDFSFSISLGIGLFIGFVGSLFFCVSGQTGISSITREGKRIWLMQSLPISYQDQIKGRLFASYFFQIIAVLPVTIGLLIIFKPPFEMILGYIIGAVVAGFFSSNIGLLIDISRPKLNWNSPQEAIKQNMNILFFIIGTMAYIALLGFGIFKLFEWKVIGYGSLIYVAGGVAVIHIILGIIVLFLDVKMFEKNLRKYSLD